MGRYNLIQNTSRLMAVLLALTLLLCLSPAVYADGESGQCGSELSWSLSAGTLTITGSGAMDEYNEFTMAPWYTLRDEILRLVLPEGLTTIGEMAFYDCEKIVSVAIPGSVTRIGDYAFAECTGMEMLSLGNVQSVGECAFFNCKSLRAVRLPDTLESIGDRGFYRCESLNTIKIPASINKLGSSAFGYCDMLVSAEICASVKAIPDLLFYGCSRLAVVTISGTAERIGDLAFMGCNSLRSFFANGSAMTTEQIDKMVSDDILGFANLGHVSQSAASDTAVSGVTIDNGDGTYTEEDTTVTSRDDATVSTTVTTVRPTGSIGETSAQIDVTVDSEEGWDNAKDAVEEALSRYNEQVTISGDQTNQPQIHVYVHGSNELDTEFLETLAGRDVAITATTANGSVWRVDGKDLQGMDFGDFSLTYELTAGPADLCEEMEATECFALRFLSDAEINAEVMIYLGESRAHQNAALFQRRGSLEKIQTVVVDDQGYAHFYLASVDTRTDYFIGMILQSEDAIIPDELLNYYGNPIRTSPIQYEITGRTSSWGMNINQVTWIMVGVFVMCIVTVGVVVFMLNKRKLKMGYVPDLGEDE